MPRTVRVIAGRDGGDVHARRDVQGRYLEVRAVNIAFR
jgi:hypothetical protein